MNANIKRTVITTLVVLVLGAGVWYALSLRDSAPANVSGAVATVNGEEISRDEFDKLQARISAEQGFDIAALDAKAKAEFQTQTIDSLVSQTLLRQAAERSNTVSLDMDKKVEDEVNKIKGQFQDESAYNDALTTEGLTEETLRTRIRSDLTTQAYLEKELSLSTVSVTDAEMRIVYDQAASGQSVPPFEEVRSQVEQMAIQQKQQQLVGALVEKLRGEADIKILI